MGHRVPDRVLTLPEYIALNQGLPLVCMASEEVQNPCGDRYSPILIHPLAGTFGFSKAPSLGSLQSADLVCRGSATPFDTGAWSLHHVFFTPVEFQRPPLIADSFLVTPRSHTRLWVGQGDNADTYVRFGHSLAGRV